MKFYFDSDKDTMSSKTLSERDKNTITKENEIEILRIIITTHRDEFDKRRKFELQAIYAVIGIFVTIIAARFLGKFDDPPEFPCFQLVAGIFFFLFVSIMIVYLIFIHRANEKNKKLAENAEDELRRIYLNDAGKEKTKKLLSPTDINSCPCNNWAFWLEVITILLFATASILVICLFF